MNNQKIQDQIICISKLSSEELRKIAQMQLILLFKKESQGLASEILFHQIDPENITKSSKDQPQK